MSGNQGEDDLRAAFSELAASLQHLRGVLLEFQHHLVDVQVGIGGEHAGAALVAARAAIQDAARLARG